VRASSRACTRACATGCSGAGIPSTGPRSHASGGVMSEEASAVRTATPAVRCSACTWSSALRCRCRR
jgi:hypothetical protein